MIYTGYCLGTTQLATWPILAELWTLTGGYKAGERAVPFMSNMTESVKQTFYSQAQTQLAKQAELGKDTSSDFRMKDPS